MHGNELRLLGAKVITLLVLLKYIAAVGTTINVFSYDAVWEHRTIKADSEQRYTRPIFEPIAFSCRTDYLILVNYRGGIPYTTHGEQIPPPPLLLIILVFMLILG